VDPVDIDAAAGVVEHDDGLVMEVDVFAFDVAVGGVFGEQGRS
jgi:hypothetical protein